MRVSFFIASVACQCVVYVCKRRNLSGYRYLFTFEPVRIASAVISFVMPAAYLICFVKKRIAVSVMKIVQHFRSDYRVFFHDLKLFGCQFTGFVEYFIINRYFTDIVQGRGSAYQQQIVFSQVIFIGLFCQLLQKDSRQLFYMVNVHTAFTVSELNYVSQNIYHHAVVFFVFINLFFQCAEQFFLFAVQHKGIGNTFVNNKAVERYSYIIGNSQFVGFAYVAL